VTIDQDATFSYDLSNQKRRLQSVVERNDVDAHAELVREARCNVASVTVAAHAKKQVNVAIGFLPAS
jgi:hypothetical protein